MLSSLLIKLAMLAVTMGVVFWIGWTVPKSHDIESTRGPGSQANGEDSVRSTGPPAVVAAAPNSRVAQLQATPGVSRQPVSEKLDLNRATEQDLEALPGIGPVLATRIVEYRQSRGAFREVEQLRNVKGIGKKTFDRIRAFVNVTPSTAPARGGRKTT